MRIAALVRTIVFGFYMSRFLKLGCAFAFISLLQHAANALPVASSLLTQEQAILYALERNAGLQAAKTLVAQAEARRVQAGRLDNPELKLGYASDKAFNDEGEQSYSVGFEQRFPLSNRLRLEKQIAADEIELAQLEVENQTRLLVHRVSSLCVHVAELQAQAALKGELLDLYTTFSEFVESRIKTGESSQVELNQIKIERYSVEQEKWQQQNMLDSALAELKELLVWEHDAHLAVDFGFDLPAVEPEVPVLTQTMLEAHPAYRLQLLLNRVALKQVDLAKAERWADIAVELFYEEERGMDAPSGLGRDRFFGVGLSVPLPLMNDGRAAVLERRSRLDQRLEELRATKVEIQSGVRLRKLQVSQLYAQAIAYDAHITQLVADNLEAMKQAYASGQIPLMELFRSQEQGYKVRSAQLTLLHDYAQAWIDWESAAAQQKVGE